MKIQELNEKKKQNKMQFVDKKRFKVWVFVKRITFYPIQFSNVEEFMMRRQRDGVVEGRRKFMVLVYEDDLVIVAKRGRDESHKRHNTSKSIMQ